MIFSTPYPFAKEDSEFAAIRFDLFARVKLATSALFMMHVIRKHLGCQLNKAKVVIHQTKYDEPDKV